MLNGITATTADTSKVQKRYTDLENSPEGLRIQEELATIRKSYLETRDKSLELKKAGDMAQARAYALGTFAPVLDKYNAIADKMVDDQVRRSAEQAAEAKDAEALSFEGAFSAVDAGDASTAATTGPTMTARTSGTISRLGAIPFFRRSDLSGRGPATAREERGRRGRSAAGAETSSRTSSDSAARFRKYSSGTR